MRRKDREITDKTIVKDIIFRCQCCRIGFYDGKQVYIVPLNYGYEYNEQAYTFYFHSALEGRKIELIQSNPLVGFELDTNCRIHQADHACGYSASYQSIIGNGIISLVTDTQEKYHGLHLIMEHYTGKNDWEFQEKMVEKVAVIKLVVEEMSCKEHE